jgi:hypothetical protein
LSNNPYDPDSIANPYGAGSPYRPGGVNNPYSNRSQPYTVVPQTNGY